MDITSRQKDILFEIIDEYAELASPVGSLALSKIFGVSSATIRAEMARLEELGLITHPHTSAGRIPTDAGYRMYVNTLNQLEETAKPAQRRAADHVSRALELRLGSQTRADFAIRYTVDMLVDLTGNLGLGTIGDQLYFSGMARLLSQPEFMDINRVQSVARLLDNLEPWLREASPGEPLNIFIGHENPIGKSSGASLIISKFRSPYSDKSYIGVLGPTRQNYGRVMALVRETGKILEKTLYER